MPASWADTPKKEKAWNRAKRTVRKDYPDVSEDSDRFYKLTMSIAQNMAGQKDKTASCWAEERETLIPLSLMLPTPAHDHGSGSYCCHDARLELAEKVARVISEEEFRTLPPERLRAMGVGESAVRQEFLRRQEDKTAGFDHEMGLWLSGEKTAANPLSFIQAMAGAVGSVVRKKAPALMATRAASAPVARNLARTTSVAAPVRRAAATTANVPAAAGSASTALSGKMPFRQRALRRRRREMGLSTGTTPARVTPGSTTAEVPVPIKPGRPTPLARPDPAMMRTQALPPAPGRIGPQKPAPTGPQPIPPSEAASAVRSEAARAKIRRMIQEGGMVTSLGGRKGVSMPPRGAQLQFPFTKLQSLAEFDGFVDAMLARMAAS